MSVKHLLPFLMVPALGAIAAPARATPVSDAQAFIKNQRRAMTISRKVRGYPVQSYQVPSSDALNDKCFTYDQGVAVMALVSNPSSGAGPSATNLGYAKDILDAMTAVQGADGSWNSAYTCSTGAVYEYKKDVGPAAWVALAIKKYQAAVNDPTAYEASFKSFVNWVSGLQNMQNTSMATSAACNTFATMSFSDGSVQHGECKSGPNYKVDSWAGTEINQEAFILLKKYGALYPSTTLPIGTAGGLTGSARADLMWGSGNTGFLPSTVFSVPQARFLTGRNDTTHHTDVNPLGVMTRLGTGMPSPGGITDANLLGSTVAEHVSTQAGSVNGVSKTITGFDYEGSDMPTSSGSLGVDDVWFEGTGQMTLAFYLVGDAMNGDYYLGSMEQGQWGAGACNGAASCGGIQYSLRGTPNGYWTMSKAPAISPTGFYLMAVDAKLHPAAPFNPYAI